MFYSLKNAYSGKYIYISADQLSRFSLDSQGIGYSAGIANRGWGYPSKPA